MHIEELGDDVLGELSDAVGRGIRNLNAGVAKRLAQEWSKLLNIVLDGVKEPF